MCIRDSSISSRYNHLGQLTQIEDASGTRTVTYNQYNEQEMETTAGLAASVLTPVSYTHLDVYKRQRFLLTGLTPPLA